MESVDTIKSEDEDKQSPNFGKKRSSPEKNNL